MYKQRRDVLMDQTKDDLINGRKFASYAKKTLHGLQRDYMEQENKRCEACRRLWEKEYGELNGKNVMYGNDEEGFSLIEINDLLNSLSEIQRKIIELIVLQQFSEKYVAESMKITQQRVNRIKMSAIAVLRKELSEGI